jgi:alpha-mannosidase II
MEGRATANRCAGGLSASSCLLFAFLFALSLSARVLAKQDEKVVKVFLIPHSHCDPGWLETFEGYHSHYVERILTEVMKSLALSPDRRFVWAEISFFSRWFDTKSVEVKQQVRKFVENGQLEFVEGGWVQPDEANTNFDILVNQLTEGHDYLLKNFGVRPRFAWQIDPFGHSSLTPTLAAAVGFDALVINRIHHNLKSYFKQTRHMEFVWQGSPSLGEQSEIFTHVLHTHYSAPLGFDFEEGGVSVVGGNAEPRARQLVSELKSRSEAYRTDNLLVTFGDDFKFQRAEHQFSNMDKLISEINKGNYGMKIQYATLSEYFDAVFAAKVNFPLYKGDFFPYADNSDSYWTGYYTTRPRLKGLIRQATSILHSADTAYALSRARDFSKHIPTQWDSHYSGILQSRRDTCLVQHHDGITGTAKPFVAEDYTNRLNSAISHSHETMAEMTKHLLCDTKQDAASFAVLKQVEFTVYDPQGRVFTVDASSDHPLVYHNALGWTRFQYVQVKVSATDPLSLRIFDANDKPVPVQTSPANSNNGVAEPANKSVFFLNFLAEVPPLGIATYFVRAVESNSVPEVPRQHTAHYYKHGDLASKSSTLRIENDFLTVTLSPKTGLPEKLINKVTGQEITLDQKYAEYHTSRSGAYLFRPTNLRDITGDVEVSIVAGDLMSEIVIGFGARRRLSLRLYSTPKDPHAYPEVCGVLFTTHQIDAEGNREVVVRYNTQLSTDNSFYTDNGIEMQLRSRNSNQARSRAHIESGRAEAQETQYYPSISIAMLRHNAQDLQFTVISGQSMGTSSHVEGGLEIMLNRHLTQDDGRGLGEGVQEHEPVTVQQWLMLGHAEDAELHRRRLSLQQNHPLMPITLKQAPTPFVWADHFVNSYAPMSGSLPDNIHLLSLKARDAVSSEVVVRLMHIAEGTEAIAAPTEVLPQQFQSEVTIKLSDLLDSTTDSWMIEHPRARSLSLNYDANEVEQRVRYDSSLGLLSMKIDHGALSRGGRQNTDEDGVFLSQAALDKIESEKAIAKKSKGSSRKTLSIDDDNARSYNKRSLLNDTETYEQEVQQRGAKRRLFDPASLSIDANQRKLLAVGKDADPLTVLLRPLQMKSLLLRLGSKNSQPATQVVDERPATGQREEGVKDKAKEDELAQGRKKFREAAEERQRQKEERIRAREEERQRKESQLATEKDLVREENKAETPDTRRAEASMPGAVPSDLLAKEQQFISAGLEGERVMMMFISIVVVSLMILTYLAFHRRHASAIISVSSLAAAYPWTGGSAPQYPTGVASSPGPSGKDFYRREMDQRLYSKMV